MAWVPILTSMNEPVFTISAQWSCGHLGKGVTSSNQTLWVSGSKYLGYLELWGFLTKSCKITVSDITIKIWLWPIDPMQPYVNMDPEYMDLKTWLQYTSSGSPSQLITRFETISLRHLDHVRYYYPHVNRNSFWPRPRLTYVHINSSPRLLHAVPINWGIKISTNRPVLQDRLDGQNRLKRAAKTWENFKHQVSSNMWRMVSIHQCIYKLTVEVPNVGKVSSPRAAWNGNSATIPTSKSQRWIPCAYVERLWL